MKNFVLCLALTVMIPFSAYAASYKTDYANSTVSFAGTHAGKAFSGVFANWSAEIAFDPNDLGRSSISAIFDLSSAKTGNKMYDGTMPQADWFNVKEHPQGLFKSSAISLNEDGSYMAQGDLTLRGITEPVSFSFTLSDLSQSPVQAQGKLMIDRLLFDIGKKSDAKAEWVGQTIDIDIAISATAIQE